MNDHLFHKLYENNCLYENGQALLTVFSDEELPSEIALIELSKYEKWMLIFTNEKPTTSEEAVGFIEKWKDYRDCQVIIWDAKESIELFLDVQEKQISSTKTFTGIITGEQDQTEALTEINTEQKGQVVRLQVNNGAKFCFTDDGELKLLETGKLSFNNVTGVPQIKRAAVKIIGDQAGQFGVEVPFRDKQLNSLFSCGFEYGYHDVDQKLIFVSSKLYPNQKLNLNGRFLLDFEVFSGNRYVFEKAEGSDLQFLSSFRSLYGEEVYLKPVVSGQSSGLQFSRQFSKTVNAAPFGHFQVMNAKGDNVELLCGLAGTEYLKTDGKLEFIPNQPAYAPGFPALAFSMEQFIEPAKEQLLTEERVTSWVRMNGDYATQPVTSPFFQGSEKVLTVANVSRSYSSSPAFPLMPLAETKLFSETNEQENGGVIGDFQHQILSNERARILLKVDKVADSEVKVVANGKATIATPSGFVAEIAGQQFEKISVAFPTEGELAFNRQRSDGKPVPAFSTVTGAFQNPAMFMVLANKTNAGEFGQKGITLDGWSFDLTPGKGSKYNEYSNVIIIKGCAGKIYDHEDAENTLSGNPDRWTSKESFAQPGAGLGEIANLSQWLLNYCRKSYERYEAGDASYGNFVKIIQDSDWKGVLVLNVELKEGASGVELPECMRPLLAGVGSSDFKAHHLGVELVPLMSTPTGPTKARNSSFFGLIDYQAPDYHGQSLPITDSESNYEFRLLKLQVQFENNVMKDFSSVSQFVLGQFMGIKPKAGGLLYHALLLKGSIQSVNGCNTLLLQTDGGCLNFEGPLAQAEITDITMTTIDQQHFAFDFSGSLQFEEPIQKASQASDVKPIDIFSYEKLSFANYRILLSKGVFSVIEGGVTFDLDHSTIRKQSLVSSFRLQPVKVRIGKDLTKDYHGLAIENFQAGDMTKAESGALEFSAILGGLGGLAADSSLHVKFLLGWNDSGEAYVGIHLPGHAMLQKVIGLSLGDVRLAKREQGLVLFISQVVLQLLGKIKLPPSGALNLAVSGDGKGIGWFAAYQAKESEKKGANDVLLQES